MVRVGRNDCIFFCVYMSHNQFLFPAAKETDFEE